MIRFFRKYERYIFWGIVFVILPAFPISGIMLSTCGRQGPKAVGELYGKAVMADEFELERSRLTRFQRLSGERELDDASVWEHRAFLEQCDRSGVDVSDDELTTEIQSAYRDLQAQKAAIERIRGDKQFSEIRDQRLLEQIFEMIRREEMSKVVFDFDAYTQLLKNVEMTPSEFEHTFREMSRIRKLRQLVALSAKPDVEKLYDAYEEQSHRRGAAYVAFRGEDYPIGATASADELQKHYDRTPERYSEPSRVAIEWVSVQASSFEKDVPAPADAELAARYEAVKARYKVDSPVPATAGAAVESYRPLADVKAELAAEVRSEQKLDRAAKKAEELRAAAASSEMIPLAALASGAGAVHGVSGLVEELDLIRVKEVQFWNLLNWTAKLTTASAQAATSQVARHDEGTSAFFIRLVERRPARIPSFAECKARVEESYLRGLDEDLRKFHAENTTKYRSPSTASIEWVFVPYTRFEKQVPETVTGEARAAELRKKAEARLEEVRVAAGERTQEGKLRDLETVAADKGAEHGHATVETGGKDLPAQVKATETIARLSGGTDKTGELSPAAENDARTGVFFYTVRMTKAEQQLTLADCKERVRKDLLDTRAYDRARDAAESFSKEAALHPEELRALAAKRGYKVGDTGLLGRKEKVEALPGAGARLMTSLFGLPELGAVSGAVHDMEGRVSVVVRLTAKEPADPKGFAAVEKELAESPRAVRAAREEVEKAWSDGVLLEAQGVDNDVLKEVYALRYGAEGLARIDAAQIYIGIDGETIKEELGKRAKLDAFAALGDVRKGARFDDLARKRSQDSFRRRGGDTNFFKRGALPRDLAGVVEVENIAFTLRAGETSEPFESSLGWHLVQVTERRGEEVRIRHMLFRRERQSDEDGNLLPLDGEVEKLALERSREKAEKAAARLAQGEDFLAVAKDVSDEPYLATKRSYEYETGFERAVFAEPLGVVSQVLPGEGESWQLILVDEGTSRADREREERLPKEMRSRMVRRIDAKGDRGKKTLEQVREELVDFQVSLEREGQAGRSEGRGRSSWEYRKKFEDLAKDESDAASGARGGRVGVFHPDVSVARFGGAFRDALYALKDGETSAVVKGKDGYHIIRVIGREKKSYDQARHEVADALLDGMTF